MGWNSCIKLENNMRREKGNVCGMIKDDRIYQVLLKYNFDLFRGDKNIIEYMREHCNQFVSLKNRIAKMKKVAVL